MKGICTCCRNNCRAGRLSGSAKAQRMQTQRTQRFLFFGPLACFCGYSSGCPHPRPLPRWGRGGPTPTPTPAGAGAGRSCVTLPQCLTRPLRGSPSPTVRWEKGRGDEGHAKGAKSVEVAGDGDKLRILCDLGDLGVLGGKHSAQRPQLSTGGDGGANPGCIVAGAV